MLAVGMAGVSPWETIVPARAWEAPIRSMVANTFFIPFLRVLFRSFHPIRAGKYMQPGSFPSHLRVIRQVV
jgi:hypothetical protein